MGLGFGELTSSQETSMKLITIENAFLSSENVSHFGQGPDSHMGQEERGLLLISNKDNVWEAKKQYIYPSTIHAAAVGAWHTIIAARRRGKPILKV